jgi:hypothetical protein
LRADFNRFPGWQPFGAEDEEFVVLMPDVVQKKAFKERIQNYDCTMNTYIVLSKNGGSTFVLVSLGGLENYLRGIDNYRRLDLAKTTFTDIYLKRLNHGNEAITTIKENGPLHLGDLEGEYTILSLTSNSGQRTFIAPSQNLLCDCLTYYAR